MANNYLSNSGWDISSGTWQIVTSTIKGSTVKAIKCLSAGSVNLPTTTIQQNNIESSYGTWEFYVNTSALIDFQFISNLKGSYTVANNTGYFLEFFSGYCKLYKSAGGGSYTLISTNVPYTTINAWNKVKITRTSAGLFTVLLNDVTIHTLTDTTYTNVGNYITFTGALNALLALSDKSGNYGFKKTLLS